MIYEELGKEIENQFGTIKKQRERYLEPQMYASWDAFKGKYDSGVLKKWRETEGTRWRSSVFVRATKMKIVSSCAILEDIMLQSGKLPWDISPTEIPESALPNELQLPQKVIEQRCENMKRKITDTIEETYAVKPHLNAIQEKAIYGWSWLHFPVLKKYQRLKFVPQVPETDMLISEDDKISQMRFFPTVEDYWLPSIIHPSVWDVYWDLEDSNPQTGQCICVRMDISPGMFRSIVEEKPKLYDKKQMEEIIDLYKDATGTTSNRNPYLAELGETKRGIVWIKYYGKIEKKLLKRSGVETIEKEGKEQEIICELAGVEDDLKVIRIPKQNKLPLQRRPLYISRWEYSPHEPGGIGIAENVKDSQQMINSAYRHLIDNKALSGNVMFAGHSSALAPGVSKHPYPGKWYELAEGIADARTAMQQITVQDVGNGLLDLINLAERFMDEEANLPKILQGEMARHQPKTAFETQQLLQSANKTLNKVVRNTDDEHIEPYISSLYTYYMIADPNENIKGDYTCKATGFNSFMDKQIKASTLLNIYTFALSNAVTALMTDLPPMWEKILQAQDVGEFYKGKDKIDAIGDQIAMALQANAQTQATGMPPGQEEQERMAA
jgi:hypothetical protein